MKKPINIIISALAAVSLSSCMWKAGPDNAGIEYAPDMYYSKGYEPMTQYSDSTMYRYNPYYMSMREPVAGTVAVGQLDYQYAYDNTPAGYEAAGAALQAPAMISEKDQIKGERLFGIYCAVCHGMTGKNDGPVSTKQAALKPSWANYQDQYVKDLPIGKIYHVITYGKNNMGSYAYALTPTERWSIATYVKRLSMMDSTGAVPPIQVATVQTQPIDQMHIEGDSSMHINNNQATEGHTTN
ncbi:MAG: cytochrome c [Bacteroidia bacterium]